MEITNIKVKDFCCFGEFDIPLNDNGLVWVSGENNDSEAASSNGSGKSTIFKALVWGLYGNTIDGEKGDNVIRAGAKKAVVTIELAGQEGTWTIQRTRTKGTTKLALSVPGGEDFKASTKELQGKIINLLGLDFLAFRNTVLYGQNDINRFTHAKTSDADRKEMLHCILRSNIFSTCREFVKDDKQRLKADIQDKEAGIGQLEARISEYDIEDLETKLEEWRDKEKRRKLRLEAEMIEARDELSAADLECEKAEIPPTLESEYHQIISENQDKKDALKGQADEMEAHIKGKVSELEEQEENTRRQYAILEGNSRDTRESINKARAAKEEVLRKKERSLFAKREEVNSLTSQFNTESKLINEALAKLEVDTCPVCNTPTDSMGVDEYRAGLKSRLGVIDTKLAKLNGVSSKISDALSKLKDSYAVVADEFEALIKEDSEETSRLQAKVDEQIEKIKTEIKGARAELDNVKLVRTDVEECVQKILDAQQTLNDAKSKSEMARNHRYHLQNNYDRAVEAIDNQADSESPFAKLIDDAKAKTDEHAVEMKSLSKRVVGLRKELAMAEFWDKGFSNQGVASYVLDSVMPYLTERANYYLEILADGDIKVMFSTQKEMKSSKNEYRDKIDISWMIEGQVTSYPPSGGQAKKIEIATDLALMDLVTYREGHNTNILILDEVLDGLDDTGRQRVLQLLQEVNKFRNTVFVISHSADMSEVFESYITVEKNEGVSKIKHLSLP